MGNIEQQFTPTMPAWKKILLWIALLPGAVLGSTIGFWIAKLFTWLGSSVYGNNTWLDLISREVLVNGVAGYTFVYCAAFIAPEYKKITAICFAGFILLLTGISIVSRIAEKDWMGLLGVISYIGGGIGVAVSIVMEETEIGVSKEKGLRVENHSNERYKVCPACYLGQWTNSPDCQQCGAILKS